MIGTSIDRAALPKGFADIDELESFMARPSQDLIDDLAMAVSYTHLDVYKRQPLVRGLREPRASV